MASGLLNYLIKNYTEDSYLVVSQKATDISDMIVKTGHPAVSYSGFLRSDNAITLDKFKQLVADGKIKYFLASNERQNTNSDIETYVKENATIVDSSEYQKASESGANVGKDEQSSLYVFK